MRTASLGLRMRTLRPWTRISPASTRVGAEDGPGHLGAPGAHETGKPEDLPLARLEAHVLDRAALLQVPHVEDHFVTGRYP